MKFLTNFLIILILSAVLPVAAFSDTIYLNDGSIIKGLVVEEHCDRIVFSTADGEKVILNKDIDEIFFDDLAQNYYYIANKFLDDKDFERAEKFYKKSLELNPDYKIAEGALLYLGDVRLKEAKRWDCKDSLGDLKKELGITIVKNGDLCAIDEAAQKGSKLRVGDAIVCFWNRSARFMEPGDVASRIAGVPNTPVRLTIQRKINFKPLKVPWYFKVLGLKKRYTLPLEMKYHGLTIGKLTNFFLESKSDFKVGDRIVAIDGKPTRYMPLSEANALINKKKSGEVELTINRDLEVVRY